MNKFTKASIATGAAIVLLLGGAGTFALWNDSKTVAAGTVQSGVLTLTGTGTGSWYRVVGNVDGAGNSETDDAAITNIANYRIVPGDKLVFKATGLTVTARGDNLKAKLTFSTGGGTNSFPNSLTTSVVALGTLPTGVTNNVDNSVHIEPGAGTSNITFNSVAAVVDFASTAVNDTQTKSIDLAALTFQLNQVLTF
ncbi:MAG: alternate-type signal peptide domain-containing protein [Protaetiibacter sp.]